MNGGSIAASRTEPVLPTIVVEVMPKQEILDPAGKAVARALDHQGKDHITAVRIGKRFELTTDREPTPELFEDIARIASDLLANEVIEDVVSISVLPEPEPDPEDADSPADSEDDR